jgi:predicted CXXCH cytochrome family protein
MDTCLECHPKIVQSHLKTSHYKTSKLVDFNEFVSLTSSGNNVLNLGSGDSIVFTKGEGKLYQEGYINHLKEPSYKKSMDVVLGSGNRGQSFLNWEDTSLFQLQGSLSVNRNLWINSPGYAPSLSPMRPIFPRCLECHATYARPENPSSALQNNRYVKNQIIYGIDCQRCHGEVTNHVKHHLGSRMDTIGKYILSYADFTQKQRINMCALCHSGVGQKSKVKSFSFQPGDELADFIATNNTSNLSKKLDVHANQVGLLMASKCFQESEDMDCMTCHDPHKQERGMNVKFNSICVSCHQGVKHKENTRNNSISLTECIECHMPLQKSQSMKLELDIEQLTSVQVRSHYIGINKLKKP